jgi:phosphoserine phosphatase
MEQSCKYYCYRNTRDAKKYKVSETDKIELVVFDMDGVITDTISSWKYIHDYFGSSNARSVDEYLKGKIDDMEFIKRDVALWKENGKPIKKDKLVDILSDVPLMSGAKKCMTFLSNKSVKTAIVSAGLDILAERVAKDLDIDYVFANGIKSDERGFITGEGLLNVRLMYKDEAVKRLAKQSNVSHDKIAAVGNSCFDIPMFEICGTGIAFNPEDECVRELADFVVEGKDLSKLIPVFEQFIN